MGSQGTYFERLNGQLQVVDRTGWGGKVENVIHRSLHGDKLGHIMPQETKPLFSP